MVLGALPIVGFLAIVLVELTESRHRLSEKMVKNTSYLTKYPVVLSCCVL